MCRWLAEHRADFGEADAEGRTPLHHAAWHGAEPDLAAWLVATGASAALPAQEGSAGSGGGRPPLLLRRDSRGRAAAEVAAARAVGKHAGPQSRKGRLAA